MKVLVIGTTGMLGHDIASWMQEHMDIGSAFSAANRPEIDLSDRESVRKRLLLARSFGTGVVVNCAASTDVARIESDRSATAESFRTNVLGPRYLAEACQDLGLRLVHFSTDYVYSQDSLGTKIFRDEFPANLYGTHKLLGEKYVEAAMGSGNYAIVRIGCLYGIHRTKSFLHRLLKNLVSASLTGENAVDVIDFQESTPTSTMFVAHNMRPFLDGTFSGTCSLSPTGRATRAEFAKRFLETTRKCLDGGDPKIETGLDEHFWSQVRVNPVPAGTTFLPEVSVLDDMNRTSHLRPDTTWEEDLDEFVRLNISELMRFTRLEMLEQRDARRISQNPEEKCPT